MQTGDFEYNKTDLFLITNTYTASLHVAVCQIRKITFILLYYVLHTFTLVHYRLEIVHGAFQYQGRNVAYMYMDTFFELSFST